MAASATVRARSYCCDGPQHLSHTTAFSRSPDFLRQIVHHNMQGGNGGPVSSEPGVRIPGGWYERPDRVASVDTHMRIAPDGKPDLVLECPASTMRLASHLNSRRLNIERITDPAAMENLTQEQLRHRAGALGVPHASACSPLLHCTWLFIHFCAMS